MRLSTAAAISFSLLLAGSSSAFQYGTDTIRGVGLGGWLVLETFLTPSIFTATGDTSVIDEYTYGKKYGSAAAGARLKSHWDTFINETDFKLIKSYGLNHVRLPIGYWSIVGNSSEPYPTGAYPYVKKAVDWAKKYDIKVIIDIHGAPGSQNGFDNSGRKGPIRWHTSTVNVQRTRDALAVLIKDFIANPAYKDTVTSVEPLNEPGGFTGGTILDVTKQFYYDTYGQTRYPYGNSTQSSTLLSLHDAFQNYTYWQGFMSYPGWNNVALDTHFYTLFSDAEARQTIAQHIQAACNKRYDMVNSNKNLWTYAGEFTGALTDCSGSTTLNKYLGGSFYDGTAANSTNTASCTGKTGSAAKFSTAMKNYMRRYWEAQVDSFEAASGWSAWTWKTESGKAEEWSYMKGVQYGWIPNPPTARKYKSPCTTTGLDIMP